ncbi:MAG: hypothetical protein ACM3JK_02220 [Betaproteobacteria bacterium]
MSLWNAIIEFFQSLFGTKPTPPPPPPPHPTVPPDNTTEPAQIVTSRVLVIVYDPVVDSATGKRLSEHFGWSRADDLITGFISDITDKSKGLARYQVVQRQNVDEFLPLADGFCYNVDSYLSVFRHTTPEHTPGWVDYNALLGRFNILQRITNHELDEVWVFAFPYAGFYESVMAGAGAFWCNSNPLPGTSQTPQRFLTMGFSLERGVGEMLESFTHRCESVMTKVYEHTSGDANLYARFSRYDKQNPGQAECGTVHYAPNSDRDYDWGNPRYVPSKCDDWYNFPHFTGATRQVNCVDWGNGDIRLHHLWWLDHLPRVSGRINGIANNWWQYVIDPNRVNV